MLCAHFAARLLRNPGELLLALVGLCAAFGLAAAREPRIAWLAPLALVPALFVGFVLPRPARTWGH